ncbi:MAG: hypothetical protein JSS22_13860 [Proteobacteria bacterium]|nr:hypothetical protein [Pseudomonadota bacterium]
MAVKGATSESIVNEFIKHHGDAITRENAELNRIALMKIVQNVGKAATGPTSTVQIEMFAEYGIDRMVMITASNGEKQHRKVETLSVMEAHTFVEAHMKPKSRLPSQVKEMTRLLDTVEPYKTNDRSTIGECWKKYRKAGDS